MVQGYPGKTARHGALGWSTVALLRGGGEVILVDTGSYGYRDLLVERLAALGLRREDVTAILCTHLHWDHLCNYPFFPNARVHVPRADLEWAVEQPVGTWSLPELHVEKLAVDRSVVQLQDGDEPFPGLRAVHAPGHTPGSMGFVAAGERGRLVLTGDAVKNQAELLTEKVDLTLDAAASAASVRRLRELAAEDPENIVVCGHDRLLSVRDGRAVLRAPLEAGIRARFTADFEREEEISLEPRR